MVTPDVHEVPFPLPQELVDEAVRQMLSHCKMLMGQEGYAVRSARGVLYELGYSRNHADQILRFLADRGFNYCLDPMVTGETGDACYWGADQLKSRLQFIVPIR